MGEYGNRVFLDVAAYHEAGHVLSALNEGLWVKQAHVSFADPGAGYIVHAPLPPNPFDPGDGPGSARAAWQHTVHTTVAVIRIALAGPLAEAKSVGTPLRALGARSDLDMCQLWAVRLQELHAHMSRYVPLPPVGLRPLLNEQRRRVRRWLGVPKVWGMVSVLAARLYQHGFLTGEEIGDVLGARIKQTAQGALWFKEP